MAVLKFLKAKAPAPLSEERQDLAAAIARVAEAKAALVRIDETFSESAIKINAAHAELGKIEEERGIAAEKAIDFVRAKIAGGEGAAPPGSRRRVSLDHREANARRDIEVWRGVRTATTAVAGEARKELQHAEASLDLAVRRVLSAEAGERVETLLSCLEALNREAAPIRAALHELLWASEPPSDRWMLDSDLGRRALAALGKYGLAPTMPMIDYTPPGYQQDPVKLFIDSAIARLREDPAAPLPSIDQIRSVANG